MADDAEIKEFLLGHLNAIRENDIQAYHATTSEDLTLYEWWVTPHRLDGLPFHDFMMRISESRGTIFGAEDGAEELYNTQQPIETRFDLANLHIQQYADTAIASYTLLVSSGSSQGVFVAAHNESRVIVKIDGRWQVVHVHKSPAWPAPHIQPKTGE